MEQSDKKERVLTTEEKDTVLDEILDLIEEKISIKDCKAIAEAANYEIEKVKRSTRLPKTVRATRIIWSVI